MFASNTPPQLLNKTNLSTRLQDLHRTGCVGYNLEHHTVNTVTTLSGIRRLSFNAALRTSLPRELNLHFYTSLIIDICLSCIGCMVKHGRRSHHCIPLCLWNLCRTSSHVNELNREGKKKKGCTACALQTIWRSDYTFTGAFHMTSRPLQCLNWANYMMEIAGIKSPALTYLEHFNKCCHTRLKKITRKFRK